MSLAVSLKKCNKTENAFNIFPFTTEQVEDVKVLFNMIKVLLSLSPVFVLNLTAALVDIHHITVI